MQEMVGLNIVNVGRASSEFSRLFLPPWEIGLPDSHAIFSSLLSLAGGMALSRFSQAPLPLSGNSPQSLFFPALLSLPSSPSFLFLGINRSRWEDSTRGERIRLPSLPFNRNSPQEQQAS